jgi:hypothetical protein
LGIFSSKNLVENLRYAQIDFSALAITGLKGHALEMIIPVGRELKPKTSVSLMADIVALKWLSR